jgi:hypothetical protein
MQKKVLFIGAERTFFWIGLYELRAKSRYFQFLPY